MSRITPPERTALLTGRSDGGLGASLALAFHAAGLKVYATAPNQRTTILHAPVGDGVTRDGTTTFDGRAGWINAANTLVPMLMLTGGNLDGARVDAALSFPGGIKQALSDWRDGFPETNIDGRDVAVVQGTSGKSTVKLYFDKKSGLLVR
ncbi:hypothetical protein B4Q13_23130, partial [Lacticaseibacillus rhamnosus]